VDHSKPDLLTLPAVALSVTLLVAACAGSSTEPPSGSTSTGSQPTTSSSTQSVTSAPVTSSTIVNREFPSWATSTLVEMDPISLMPVGPAIPAGLWTEGSAVTEDLIAVATWPNEESDRADPRWRLVVASRESGELLFDERVGDMNVLGMFASASGEVMIVEPIRSADWNHADGFVVRGYHRARDELREVARFDEGDFYPSSLTLLSSGHLGVVGIERTGDVFDRYRIVVFDWQSNETVTDVILDGLAFDTEAPEGVFVDSMHHPLIWDEARSRALVVHADEDVISAVALPSGEVKHVRLHAKSSLMNAFFGWLVPSADAKGLPSFQRRAVISGDMYVVGAAVTFESNDNGTHNYQHSATDLLKIDLDTLRIVDRSRPGATMIAASPDGGYLLAGGQTTTGRVGIDLTTVDSEEYTDLLVIDPETLDVVSRHDEVNLTSEYQVQIAPAENLIYIEGARGKILTFAPTSGKLQSTDATGFERVLLGNSLRYESQSS
jgi:hypothetical protein